MCTLLLRTRGECLGFHIFSKRKSRKEREGRGNGLEGKRDKRGRGPNENPGSYDGAD